jgi:hypothetical protein
MGARNLLPKEGERGHAGQPDSREFASLHRLGRSTHSFSFAPGKTYCTVSVIVVVTESTCN